MLTSVHRAATTQLTTANLLAHTMAVGSYDTTACLNGNYYFNKSFIFVSLTRMSGKNTYTRFLWESTTTTSVCDA